MLDDFNHHHHHAVFAGSCGRLSSTHRVALTATDTWQHIWARAELALATPLTPPGGGAVRAAALRLCEEARAPSTYPTSPQSTAPTRRPSPPIPQPPPPTA